MNLQNVLTSTTYITKTQDIFVGGNIIPLFLRRDIPIKYLIYKKESREKYYEKQKN